MKSIKLSAATPWVEQPAPPSAWKSADAGLLHGPAHSSIGQEGGADREEVEAGLRNVMAAQGRPIAASRWSQPT